MIFDEVDVGIGGSVAEIVGKLLKELGNHEQRQVLVITHLPQVASLAVHHYKVSKTRKTIQTLSHIHLMDDKMRVDEIARMFRRRYSDYRHHSRACKRNVTDLNFVGAGRFSAFSIDIKRMLLNNKSFFTCNNFLSFFNFIITKFFHMTTLHTHDMIVML
jgi:hypothetical protein